MGRAEHKDMQALLGSDSFADDNYSTMSNQSNAQEYVITTLYRTTFPTTLVLLEQVNACLVK